MAFLRIAQTVTNGNMFLRLKALLILPWPSKEGSGCAFFVPPAELQVYTDEREGLRAASEAE